MRELRYLNKYLKKYRTKLLIGLFITIISRIFSLFTPRLIGNSLTAVEKFILNNKETFEQLKELMLFNIVAIIGATLLSAFFTFLMRQTIINVSRYIEYELKSEIFNHYQKLSQRFYKNNRIGDMMSRISEDVSKVRMYVGPAIMYSINTITLFIFVITIMISIAPKLSFYALIPLPLLSFIIYRLSKVINTRSIFVQEMLARLSSFSQESFSGISVIKSYTLETFVNKDFDDLASKAKSINMGLVKVQAWFFPLMILLIGLSNLIVIFVGGKQYINDEIEIGVLAEFIVYINMLTWPVAAVGWVTSVVQEAEASQKRINKFLNQKVEIKNGIGVKKSFNGEIVFENVTLIYPETNTKALDNLSFKIKVGEKVGIVGKVGSGKSSLLNLINRLYDVNEGKVLIGGSNIKDFKLDKLRSLIGNVMQNPFLFSESIKDNLLFGKIDATKEEIEKACKNAAIHKTINSFKNGYDTILGERGLTLSGGQIQRVSIARALIKNPQFFLFDDCLSAVDLDTENKILKNIKVICQNKTTIMVSNRISSIKDSDKIFVLENGKIIETGNHKTLMENKNYYSNLFNRQQNDKKY